MSGLIPFEDRARTLEDIERHGRCLAIELRSLGIAYDTLVVNGQDSSVMEGWEVPAGQIPAGEPMVLARAGIYTSQGERIIGRKVYPISEAEIARHGAAQAIRRNLIALETKHDIFEKMRKGSQNPEQPA